MRNNQSILNVEKGLCRSPLYSEDEVSEVVGSRHWLARPCFPVQQGTKVRPVDDGSSSGSSANSCSCMTETSSVPCIDKIIAVRRTSRTASSVPLALLDCVLLVVAVVVERVSSQLLEKR